MRYRLVLALLLALAAPWPARAETVLPLAVGADEVRVVLPEGYRRASEDAPALFATSAAAMPPPVRLVEVLLSEADLKRMLAGGDVAEPYLQVQAVRDAEALRFSAREWRDLQPTLAQQLGAIDLDAATRAIEPGIGARMGEASGGRVDIHFGPIGKPVLYQRDDAGIRYVLRVPVSGTVNGQPKELVLDCAVAMLVLNGKLVSFNAYLRPAPDEDGVERVRAFLDAAVARALALNAEAPAPAAAAGR